MASVAFPPLISVPAEMDTNGHKEADGSGVLQIQTGGRKTLEVHC